MNGFFLGLIAAGAALQAAPGQPLVRRTDVCHLLSAEDISGVQGATVTERKPSGQDVKALHFAQCAFVASDFPRSISLTLISGTAGSGSRSVRAFWEETFGRPEAREQPAQVPAAAGREREEPTPRRVAAAGEEAVYTGDARAGALYVLSDQVVLRISVGGVQDEQERIRRSAALAQQALRRLRQNR